MRGRDLIARCPVCLYAGSIVPRELLGYCPPGARIVDTAPLSLDEIDAEFAPRMRRVTMWRGCIPAICRSIRALAEQLRRLEPARHSLYADARCAGFRRAAAALGCELTVPEVAQSVVLTRVLRPRLAHAGDEKLATFRGDAARRWSFISPSMPSTASSKS